MTSEPTRHSSGWIGLVGGFEFFNFAEPSVFGGLVVSVMMMMMITVEWHSKTLSSVLFSTVIYLRRFG